MTEDVCEVIITAADEEWLVGLTRSLVEDRLAACGQHIGPVRSIYRWDQTVHDETEVRVALHTRASLVAAIIARVVDVHPYEVPCVLAVPVLDGNPAYLAWVGAETRSDGAAG